VTTTPINAWENEAPKITPGDEDHRLDRVVRALEAAAPGIPSRAARA